MHLLAGAVVLGLEANGLDFAEAALLGYQAHLGAFVQLDAFVGSSVVEMTLPEYGIAGFEHRKRKEKPWEGLSEVIVLIWALHATLPG